MGAKIDLNSMTPSAACGFITDNNSLGVRIAYKTLKPLWAENRFRLISKEGDEKKISLLKLLSFLADPKNRKKDKGIDAYEYRKEAELERQLQMSLTARDIGELPEVVNPERKELCKYDFRLFCENYFSNTFQLAWSDDHLRVISKIENSVLNGGLFALALPRGSGKALALDTPLATPKGWTTMGEVKVGDTLFDENGKQCKVLLKSEIFTDHDCYKVTFNDGEEIICDAEHLWQVEDIWSDKNPCVKTTKWMSTRFKIGHRGYNESRFRIPFCKPLETLTEEELPVAPYALGVWLGDGSCGGSRISLFEDDFYEIQKNINNELGKDYLIEVFKKDRVIYGNLSKKHSIYKDNKETGIVKLRKLNLLNNKHIPEMYLRASYNDRLALLQGILDTDGSIDNGGHVEITIKYDKFAETFKELLSSLGIKNSLGKKHVVAMGKDYGEYYRFYINCYKDQEVFKLKRKYEKLRERPQKRTKNGTKGHTPCEIRTIVNIEKVPTVPTQCVMVDSPSHLYLAGKGMIPTHNTTLCEIASIWCMVYGHIEFIALIGATESAAQEMLSSVKTEIETNETLAEDFPEVCYPIEKLGGISNRCAGQLYKGERTRITWTSDELVLPTIEGSQASGIIVRVAGLTGRVRGMKFKRPDGKTVRPKLVIVDDPQTNESANSIEQCRKRVRVLAGDILGLAGPGQKISGLMPCTVIRPGDMADQILDRATHPEWNGERTKLLYAYPTNLTLWEEYAEIRGNCLREHGDIHLATEFYKEHQAEMDEGAVPAWPARYNKDELSAVQNAMNLKIQDEIAFMAEYQNEPLADKSDEDILMSVDEICQQLNGLKRTIVPLECTKVTMFIDVQKTLLYYCICAWSDDFTGAVIDYGSWPDQKRNRFTLQDAEFTIQKACKAGGFEGQLYSAFEQLIKEKMQQVFMREDGAEMHVERIMIDANWGQSTDTVYQYCRQSEFSGIVLPAHGRYIGASSRSMTEYKKKKGERLGFNWFMPAIAGKRAIRHVVFDTNFWKSFVHTRLGVLKGDKGSLTLWGRSPIAHQCFAEHLTAEYRVKTTGLGREVDEWKIRPDKSDNHWLDCLAGCAVGASMQGSVLQEHFHLTKKEKIKLSSKVKYQYNNNENNSDVIFVKPNNESSSNDMSKERTRIKLSDLQKNKK